MKKPEGLIFDFNGTMVFDEHFHTMAWKRFLSGKTGRDVPEDAFDEYVHGVFPAVTLRHFISPALTEKEIEALGEEKEKIYRALCLESGTFSLAPGLAELLDQCRSRAIPCAVATAAGSANIDFFFAHLPLSGWFSRDDFIGNDGTFPGKPAPDIFLRAAAHIGRDIADCVVFEDARAGVEGARNAGAGRVVGITSSHDEAFLISCGADFAVADYLDRRIAALIIP